MRLFIVMFLVSFSAIATTWSDFEVGSQYKLKQSFELPSMDRSGSQLSFMTGEEVVLKEVLDISPPGFYLMLYIFDYKNCPGSQAETDMEIIPVQGTTPVVEAGAQLNAGCELNVYIEMKDYYSESLFE